ncbi:uncharacterized protein [Drosophila pseudoobscura]|uniref:Uncharacterized protein isoform X1 n=1 Tax=Drosophila pseudoobscura pseudoobscura TaxID=46245 RepID=A0A6I8UM53_DROPS|nr:uncharacterized protein LOC4800306 isoform X1 [Drosophila pseudoobscura]
MDEQSDSKGSRRPASRRRSCSSKPKKRRSSSSKRSTASHAASSTIRKTYPLRAYASYTIRNKYPGPLQTYDGQSRGEKRLINFSDLTESYLSLVFKEVEEEEAKEKGKILLEEKKSSGLVNKKESKCRAQSPEKEGSSAEKKSSKRCLEKKKESCPEKKKESCVEKKESCPEKKKEICVDPKKSCPEKKEICTEKKESWWSKFFGCEKKKKSCGGGQGQSRSAEEMVRQEICAKRYYEMGLRRSRKDGAPWQSLKHEQKLPFYWTALTGERLRATAYSNFQQSFMRRFRRVQPRASLRRVRFEARTKWYALDRCQRLPFVVQALLYHVSTGAVDLLDQCAVRAKFRKLRGRN